MSATPAATASKVSKARDKTVGRIHRDLEMPVRHCGNRLRQSLGAGLQPGHVLGPAGHHLEFFDALRDRRRRQAPGRDAAASRPAAPRGVVVFIVVSPARNVRQVVPCSIFRPLSPGEARRRLEPEGPYRLPNSRTRVSGVGARLLIVIFGIGAVSALVAGAAIYAFVEVGHSLALDRSPRRPDPGFARSVALGRAHRDRGLGAVRRHHRAATRPPLRQAFPPIGQAALLSDRIARRRDQPGTAGADRGQRRSVGRQSDGVGRGCPIAAAADRPDQGSDAGGVRYQ